MSVILISNSAAVLNRKFGAAINSFDTIVRFNNFETKNYEEYIGSRTDIWFTRVCKSIKNKDVTNIQYIYGIINCCKFTKDIQNYSKEFLKQYPQATLIDFDKCKKYNQLFHYNQQKTWLSIGLISILFLLEQNTELPLYLYGFEGDITKHYCGPPPQDYLYHDFKKERDYLVQLNHEGKVKFYG